MALFDPAGTVTDAGTVRFVELELRATAAPAGPLAPFRLTVQDALAEGPKDAGLQETELTVGEEETVIEPPVAEVDKLRPAEDAADTLVTPIDEVAAFAVRVKLATAATPFAIAVLLTP